MENDFDRSDGDDSVSSTPGEGNIRPTIQDAPGETPRSARAAEIVLAATGAYYISGGALVRVINRPSRGISVEQVHEQTLKLVMADMINWVVKGRDGIEHPINPPHGVVQALMHGQDCGLPVLNGLARQPYFDVGGRLVTRSGYDAHTGIYAAFDEAEYPMLEPTQDLAEECLKHLNSFLAELSSSLKPTGRPHSVRCSPPLSGPRYQPHQRSISRLPAPAVERAIWQTSSRRSPALKNPSGSAFPRGTTRPAS